jgi:hypothetical protein
MEAGRLKAQPEPPRDQRSLRKRCTIVAALLCCIHACKADLGDFNTIGVHHGLRITGGTQRSTVQVTIGTGEGYTGRDKPIQILTLGALHIAHGVSRTLQCGCSVADTSQLRHNCHTTAWEEAGILGPRPGKLGVVGPQVASGVAEPAWAAACAGCTAQLPWAALPQAGSTPATRESNDGSAGGRNKSTRQSNVLRPLLCALKLHKPKHLNEYTSCSSHSIRAMNMTSYGMLVTLSDQISTSYWPCWLLNGYL